ncbi:DUF928 domain-containing protein [Pedobacter chinensis]|nr:DUF928 domain-containing protein [Pedobacter chinensis]
MRIPYQYLVMLLLLTIGAKAQTSIQFIPEVYGTTINGLFRASIFNSGGAKNVRINITVSEAKAGKVLMISTGSFTLMSGNNVIPVGVAQSANVALSENATANFIRRNQYFPQGDYEYDFNIISASSSEEIIDQIFSHEVSPPAPLDLIEPYDQDEICENRPLLTWQPSVPHVMGLLYQVVLVEVKEKQNAVEALNYNLPVINQKGVMANLLLYPPNAKDLSKGKKYAWQVTAYKDQTVINRSDIWSFQVNCSDTLVNVVENDFGYRDIEDLVKGNFYVSDGFVRFALVNSYAEQKLQYEVLCVSHPEIKIKRLPSVKLKRGHNKINLDFSHNLSFKDGYSYVMKVNLPSGTTKSLRFIYKEKE